jgi:hypothetical protein
MLNFGSKSNKKKTSSISFNQIAALSSADRKAALMAPGGPRLLDRLRPWQIAQLFPRYYELLGDQDKARFGAAMEVEKGVAPPAEKISQKSPRGPRPANVFEHLGVDPKDYPDTPWGRRAADEASRMPKEKDILKSFGLDFGALYAKKNSGLSREGAIPEGKNGFGKALYDTLRDKGYTAKQAGVISGEVYREQEFKRHIVFGAHSEPGSKHKGRENIGMISWGEPSRRKAFKKHMADAGFTGVYDDPPKLPQTHEALKAQVDFMHKEMTKSKAGRDFLESNDDASLTSAIDKYVGWDAAGVNHPGGKKGDSFQGALNRREIGRKYAEIFEKDYRPIAGNQETAVPTKTLSKEQWLAQNQDKTEEDYEKYMIAELTHKTELGNMSNQMKTTLFELGQKTGVPTADIIALQNEIDNPGSTEESVRELAEKTGLTPALTALAEKPDLNATEKKSVQTKISEVRGSLVDGATATPVSGSELSQTLSLTKAVKLGKEPYLSGNDFAVPVFLKSNGKNPFDEKITNMAPEAIEGMKKAAVAAKALGLDHIVVAGAESATGHVSHYRATEFDFTAYDADGKKWTSKVRADVLNATGSNRIGLYTNSMSAHMGFGDVVPDEKGRKMPPGIWGVNGRTSNVPVTAFRPEEQALAESIKTGQGRPKLPENIIKHQMAYNTAIKNQNESVEVAQKETPSDTISPQYPGSVPGSVPQDPAVISSASSFTHSLASSSSTPRPQTPLLSTPQMPATPAGTPAALALSGDIPQTPQRDNNQGPAQTQEPAPTPTETPPEVTRSVKDIPVEEPEPKVIEPKTPSYSAALEGYGPSAERYVEDYLIA